MAILYFSDVLKKVGLMFSTIQPLCNLNLRTPTKVSVIATKKIWYWNIHAAKDLGLAKDTIIGVYLSVTKEPLPSFYLATR